MSVVRSDHYLAGRLVDSRVVCSELQSAALKALSRVAHLEHSSADLMDDCSVDSKVYSTAVYLADLKAV